MSEIQVNTSDLNNGSHSLKAAAAEIGNVQNLVNGAPGSVGNAYDGKLKQAIEGIVGGSAQTGARLQNRSVELGNELFSRATGFEAANEASFSSLSNVSNLLTGYPIDGSAYPPGNRDQIKIAELLGIAGITGITGTTLITTFRGLNDSVGLLPDGMSRSGFREIGRDLNLLAGNKKAGFVGLMDDTGSVLKKKKNKYGVTAATQVVSFGLGVAEDIGEGDNLNRALGSEGIEVGLNLLVEGGVGLATASIPVVGQIYVGYKAVMLISDATEGTMRAIGMNEQADILGSWSDKVDITEYTDKFADNIYDYFANPPSGVSN